MPLDCPRTVDTQQLRDEVSAVYSRVASDPGGDLQRFDCFQGTSKEGVAQELTVHGVNLFARRLGSTDT